MIIEQPEVLNEVAGERWARAAAAIERIHAQGLLERAILEVVSDGNLYSIECVTEGEDLTVQGPRKDPGLDTPHEALLRMELPVAFNSTMPFLEVASTFTDATVFLPEMIIDEGRFQSIRDDEGLTLTVVFGAASTDTLAEPSSVYY